MIDLQTDIPLKQHLTMRLGGTARFMADAASAEDVIELVKTAASREIPFFVLGSGSNTLATDAGYDGLVIHMQLKGVDIINDSDDSTTFKVAAGELWDDFVKLSVERELIGIEAMSAIPGTVGAAPVQNIGAYGQELADCFVELEAYDSVEDKLVTLDADTCEFSYRDSIFRRSESGRYIILSVTFRLYKASPQQPFYKAVQDYFDQHGITSFTPQIIRDAVIAIRADKLPDPALRPNTGSFFKNAIIESWLLNDLLPEYPDMPHYDLGDNHYKIPTGWLIEQVGQKGQLLHGIRVNDKNALVLINEAATGYEDLALARDEIAAKVRDQFRITIEQEPLLLS